MKYEHFLVVFFMFSSLVFSQEARDNKTSRNEIGLSLSDLFNGTYSLGYERATGKRISIKLGFGYKAGGGLIKFSGLDTDNIKTADFLYTGFKIMPEVRYYIQKERNAMLTGFYLGAYCKIGYYKSDLSGDYIDSQNITYDILYKGHINVTSVGFLIGYKLPITNHLNLDFLIAGAGAGFYKFKLRDVIPPPDQFYEDLNSALEKYSFLGLFNPDFEFKATDLKEKLVLPSFRYGISVCYSF